MPSTRKDSIIDDIMPSKDYLNHLDRWVDGKHEAALTVVRQWVRFCPYPEWVLLELPGGNWGALWSQGYGTEYTDMVLKGDYSLLSIVAETRAEVMRHMANHLMYPPDTHADMIALQRSTKAAKGYALGVLDHNGMAEGWHPMPIKEEAIKQAQRVVVGLGQSLGIQQLKEKPNGISTGCEAECHD